MPEAGQLLSERYRVERPLGKGGMGAVYLARVEALDNKPVALKELIAGEDPEAVEQFRKEASFLANLQHPNLVKVTDFFRDGERVYLVMEYVEGQTLSTVLAREGVVAVERVVAWAREICSVLSYLHGQNPPVLFRDLKPSNIMLTGDGQIRLIDFGIARTSAGGEKTSTFLKGVGSSGFAPLEQYDPERGTDARSDIYSFGATLFHLLSGKVPPSAIARSSGEELPALPDYVPSSFVALVHDCLKLRPQDRPGSIQSVMERLTDECSQSVEVPTQTMQGPATDTRPMPRRRPWGLVAILLLVVLVVGGGVWLRERRAVNPPVSVSIPKDLSTATRVAALGLERWSSKLELSGDPLLAALADQPLLKGKTEPDGGLFAQALISFLGTRGLKVRTEIRGWTLEGRSALQMSESIGQDEVVSALASSACVWLKLGHYKDSGEATYTRKGEEWATVRSASTDQVELVDALGNSYRLKMVPFSSGRLVGNTPELSKEANGVMSLGGTYDVPDGVDVLLVEGAVLVWLTSDQK